MSPPRPKLPSIDEELGPTPRRRLDLRRLNHAARADDTAVEANSRTLGQRWGASTSLGAGEGAAGEPGQAAAPEPACEPLASLRLEIPGYLDDELTVAAARQRVTKGFLVMSALAQAGYRVAQDDLVPDRRKARSRKV